MDKELSGIEGVKSRMDDILIMGKDHAQHDERLRKVIDRLVEREDSRSTSRSVYFPKACCNT